MPLIRINGLRIMARHGVGSQERLVGNEFCVDIALEVPGAARAAETDCLEHTVNYAEVVDIVKREMAVTSSLIEAVAGRIHRAIALRFGSAVTAGSVTVAKLAPPVSAQLDSVSFTLSW